jgi:glycosyltransferase involved in cell wall biosynthesis
MTAEFPLITVGVTCFNAAKTIRRAFQSAKKQDWPNIEIVVVDDASFDDSAKVLEDLTKRYPEIKVFRHDYNKGYPAALNKIVDEARGEFISLFDDDDYSEPSRLRLQYERICSYESTKGAALVICYSDRKVVKPGCLKSDHIASAIGRISPEPSGNLVADYILGVSCNRDFSWGMFGSCTMMARRTTFRAVGAFDESFRRCAEWDFAVRAAFMQAHFIATSKPLVIQYKTQTSDKQGTIPLQYALRLRRKHKTYLTRQKAYWGSLAIAKYNFFSKRSRLKGYLYLTLACALSPTVLRDRLTARYHARRQGHLARALNETRSPLHPPTR